MGDQTGAWSFPIQWARGFGEEFRFRTEIITSRNGTEQRIAQRQQPRMAYDFESFLNFANFREAHLRLSKNQGQEMAFPHPRYCTTMTSGVETETDTSRAVCFTIDDSGSMADNGKLGTMKTAMTTVLTSLRDQLQAGDILRLDINVTKWSDTSSGISYYDATPAQVDTLIAFIDGFAATGTETNFDLAAQNALAFMNGTLATSLGRRIWVFISDGQPFPAGSDVTAQATAADMLDQVTGTFAESLNTEVSCNAINIQDASTGAASRLDNTPGDGVPVVDALDPDQLLDYINSAIFGATFTVAANPGWIRDGDVVFLDDGDKVEAVDVARVSGVNLAISSAIDNQFAPGTKVYRGVQGYFSGESKLTAATSRVGLSQVEFDADPVTTYHETLTTVPESYNGKELFNFGPQWGSDQKVEFMEPVIDLDLQRGDVDRLFPSAFTNRKYRLRFVIRNDDHFNRLVGLFYRCRGRAKSFYMPLIGDEIRPQAILPGNQFTIPGADFARQYSDLSMYRAVQIKTTEFELTTGITSIAVNSVGNSVVTIQDVFPTDVTGDQIKSIRWIGLCRFESDTLNLEWITDGVAETTVQIRTLEDPA